MSVRSEEFVKRHVDLAHQLERLHLLQLDAAPLALHDERDGLLLVVLDVESAGEQVWVDLGDVRQFSCVWVLLHGEHLFGAVVVIDPLDFDCLGGVHGHADHDPFVLLRPVEVSLAELERQRASGYHVVDLVCLDYEGVARQSLLAGLEAVPRRLTLLVDLTPVEYQGIDHHQGLERPVLGVVVETVQLQHREVFAATVDVLVAGVVLAVLELFGGKVLEPF